MGDADSTDPWDTLGRKLMTDAIGDMESLSLGANLSGDPVQASIRGTVRSATSLFTRTAMGQAQVKDPPPDLFWRLPADALAAAYTVGAKAEDLAPLQTLMLDGICKGVAEDGASDEALARGRKALASVLLTGGPLSLAYGLDLSGALTAIAAETPGHHADRRAFHGWAVAGVQEPASRWVDAIREMDAIDRLPSKKGAHHDGTPRDHETVSAEEKVSDPKIAAHFVFREYALSGGKRAAKPKSVTHLYVAADGDRTWLALGENEAQLLGKVKEILSGGSALARREDLSALHAPTGFAGFVSAGLFDALSSPDDASDPTKVREFFNHVDATKNVETAPVVFLVPASDGAAKAVELRVFASRNIVKGLLSRAQ
jgi:hypothetical protein